MIVSPEGSRTLYMEYVAGGIHDGLLRRVIEDQSVSALITEYEYDAAGHPRRVGGPGRTRDRAAPQLARTTQEPAGCRRPVVTPPGLVRRRRVGRARRAAARRLHRHADHSSRLPHRLVRARRARSAGSGASRNEHGPWPGFATTGRPRRPRGIRDRPGGCGHRAALRRARCAAARDACPGNTRRGEYALLLRQSRSARGGRRHRRLGNCRSARSLGTCEQRRTPSGAVSKNRWGAGDLLMEATVEGRPRPGFPSRMLSRDSYEYDERKRLRMKTTWSFVDDPATAVALSTRYRYDMEDRVRSVELPRGFTLGFAYDGLGRLTQQSNPHGTTSACTMTQPGTWTRLLSPSVRAVRFAGPRGPMSTTPVAASGSRGPTGRAEFDHDDRNEIVERREPGGVTIRFSQGPFGEPTESLLDPAGMMIHRNGPTTKPVGSRATRTRPVRRRPGSTIDSAESAYRPCRTDRDGAATSTLLLIGSSRPRPPDADQSTARRQ